MSEEDQKNQDKKDGKLASEALQLKRKKENSGQCSTCGGFLSMDPICSCPKGPKGGKGSKGTKGDQGNKGKWTLTPDGKLVYQPKDKADDFSIEFDRAKGILLVRGDHQETGIENAFNQFVRKRQLEGKDTDYTMERTKDSLTIIFHNKEHFDDLIDYFQNDKTELRAEVREAFKSLPQLKPGSGPKKTKEDEDSQDKKRPRASSPFDIPNPLDINLIKK